MTRMPVQRSDAHLPTRRVLRNMHRGGGTCLVLHAELRARGNASFFSKLTQNLVRGKIVDMLIDGAHLRRLWVAQRTTTMTLDLCCCLKESAIVLMWDWQCLRSGPNKPPGSTQLFLPQRVMREARYHDVFTAPAHASSPAVGTNESMCSRSSAFSNGTLGDTELSRCAGVSDSCSKRP
eukprot:CAMPEP_0119333182 /NCGR_PEP_ID=MMETSP1333-20130426/84573_1 /TAXON_ID=418940 /ORGANISM="Scyphosphaera apsteinii, Strain RCC1455" /LENGTH=178 /DNA_ID=CAMNT_0007343173 /DNA_START=217 /DNA_END=754 /DNA_ORIENTATION=+